MATGNPAETNDIEVFKKLEDYPWDSDKEFQGGLSAILGPSPVPSQVPNLTLRAQCFYLSRKLSLPIDFNSYEAYISNKSATISPTPEPTSPITTTPPTSTSAPSTQTTTTPYPPATPPPTLSTATPTSPTQSQLAPQNQDPFQTPSPNNVTSDPSLTAPYPPTFAQIVQLITTGAPIPGIKEIPPTLLTGQESQPLLPKRRKPWEKNVSEDNLAGKEGGMGGTFGDRRDEHIVQVLPSQDGGPQGEEGASLS